MWIEVLTSFTSKGREFIANERRFVSANDGARWCGLGWARDLTGEVPTGEVDTSPKRLEIEGARHASTAQVK